MKKFEVIYTNDKGNNELEMFVKAQEAEALEQLNKEMLEVLKEAESFIAKQKWSLEEMIVQTKIQSIIAKAEGV